MGIEKNIEELFIFRRMAEGDKEAFRFFFDKYYADLCNFVNLYIHNPLVSEDIVQDIFVYFWEKRDRIEIETSVKAYLLRASKNKSINHIRGEKRKQIFQEKQGALADKAAEPDTDPLDADRLRNLITMTLEQLPERMREIFLLGKEQQMTYKQIALELDIAEKTVENQMGMAMKRIRETLRPYYDKLFLLFLIDFLT